MKNLQAIIEGLTSKQLPAFFENLAKQLNFPLNTSRLKTGIVEGRILGIDDVGNFIVTSGTRLKNGDIATISNLGTRFGVGSKVVPKDAAVTERGFLESLATQFKSAGHDMNVDRMKTGIVGGNRVGIDDTGRYIQTTFSEKLADGSYGTISTYGKMESACSKIIPGGALGI